MVKKIDERVKPLARFKVEEFDIYFYQNCCIAVGNKR